MWMRTIPREICEDTESSELLSDQEIHTLVARVPQLCMPGRWPIGESVMDEHDAILLVILIGPAIVIFITLLLVPWF